GRGAGARAPPGPVQRAAVPARSARGGARHLQGGERLMSVTQRARRWLAVLAAAGALSTAALAAPARAGEASGWMEVLGGERALRVNGARLRYLSGTSSADVAGAIDRLLVAPGIRAVHTEARGGATAALAVVQPGGVAPLLPVTGVAPGPDVPGVPPPAGFRRLLAAEAQGKGYQLAVYRSPSADPAAAAARLGRDLAAAGWRLIDRGGERDEPWLVAGRDGGAVVVLAGRDGDGAWLAVAAGL